MKRRAPRPTAGLRSAARSYRRTHGVGPSHVMATDYRVPDPKSLQRVGEIRTIRYVSSKAFEGPETFLFEHDFEGASRPVLFKSGSGYFVVGGGYFVQPLGIDDTGREDTRTTDCESCLRDATHPPSNIAGMGRADSVTLVSGRTVRLDGFTLAYARVGRHWQLYLLRARNVGSATGL